VRERAPHSRGLEADEVVSWLSGYYCLEHRAKLEEQGEL